MSAEILRRAAALIRERAERATPGPWEFRPRRGFESLKDNPATIGFVDTAGYFVMLREGTWATEGDMGHIASWHPVVALAVADWLEAEASEYVQLAAQSFAVNVLLATADEPVAARVSLGYHTLEQALAVARAYLGGDA